MDNLSEDKNRQIAYAAVQNEYLNRLAKRKGCKWEFVKENPKFTGAVFTVGIISGSAVGAGAGVGIGAIFGTPAGPSGVVVGGIVGGAVGGISGSVFGGIIGGMIATGVVYHHYKKWKESVEGEYLAADLTAFITQLPNLKDYICQITHDFPMAPVRTPAGHLYDRNAIEEWIFIDNTDPKTGKPLVKEDLIDAWDVIYETNKQIAILLEKDLPYLEENQDVYRQLIKGFKALKKDLQKKTNHDYKSELTEIQNRLERGEISDREFRKRINLMNMRYYG